MMNSKATTLICLFLLLPFITAKDRKCFAPVYCGDNKTPSSDWFQVFPPSEGKRGPPGLQGVQGKKGEPGVADTTITDNLKNETIRLDREIFLLNTTLIGQSQLIEEMNETIVRQNSTIEGLKSEIDQQQSQMTDMNVTISGQSITIKDKENEINKLKKDLVTQEENFGVKVRNLESRFNTLESRYSRYIASLRSTTNNLEIRINSIANPSEGAIRLANGTYRGGRVEIYHDGRWGTVCNDKWDQEDASVVCRQLGYGPPTWWSPVQNNESFISKYGEGTGHIWLDDTDCTGEETSLIHCTALKWTGHNCKHHEDAGVTCS